MNVGVRDRTSTEWTLLSSLIECESVVVAVIGVVEESFFKEESKEPNSVEEGLWIIGE